MLASLIAAALATSPYNVTVNADGLADIRSHCGHLIDTDAGKVLGESTITVQNGRVKDVRAGNAAGGGTVIELGNQTCMPGLIDSHTHLSGETSPTQYNDQFRWNAADYAIRSVV